MDGNLFKEYADIFKVLSDESRLKIFNLLRKCNVEMCACDLLELFDFSQPTLSYHMNKLIKCGLVSCRKQGSWMKYSINKDKAESIKSWIFD